MKKLWKEFKEFAFKGNVIDMAVGVILGTAITAVVTSLVQDIIMPVLSAIIKIPSDITELTLKVNNINIKYGSFLSNLINFLLMAFCIFICIKAINKVISFRKKEEEAVPAPKPEDIALLEEIRDLLKEKNKHISAYNVGSSRSSLR
ncbi:large conductance mechanosensitive channel protein MscL [Catenibacterium sp. AM22-15]|uniref:large conductance mechanosensitive channel protein MscL n=1 Tax=unclassified Catenibacterium TaxID=2643636 RepID=UPI000E3F3657|nr:MULTISPECIES: large conductance mechanosensitive channel protein MscL [unclassified Catenibacterium]RGE93670.1 large conductance mechanosensitive channel protein MscL [Catenibacterium sp. AM22-6LB]RGF02328.1 large conductance mechanosensitive channel protein MscL [Catenibacterium sp. AM22-15]